MAMKMFPFYQTSGGNTLDSIQFTPSEVLYNIDNRDHLFPCLNCLTEAAVAAKFLITGKKHKYVPF